MSKGQKVVILCGGKGSRLGGMTQDIPKPLVPIGNKPILWHIMKCYESQGFNDFVLCLGYKGEMIRNYFVDNMRNQSDFTLELNSGKVEYHKKASENFRVTFVDTGEDTLTGLRLHKVREYLEDRFLLTYGDGLGDVDINGLLKFHEKSREKHGIIGTFTGVHPYAKYGLVETDKNDVALSFSEKPLFKEHIVNGGFMIFEKEFLNDPLLERNIMLEDVMKEIIKEKKMMVYRHEGFWQAMDTHPEHALLNKLWASGSAPWMRYWKK